MIQASVALLASFLHVGAVARVQGGVVACLEQADVEHIVCYLNNEEGLLMGCVHVWRLHGVRHLHACHTAQGKDT